MKTEGTTLVFYKHESYFVGPMAEPRVLISLRKIYQNDENALTGDINELFRPHNYSKEVKRVNQFGKQLRGRPKKILYVL